MNVRWRGGRLRGKGKKKRCEGGTGRGPSRSGEVPALVHPKNELGPDTTGRTGCKKKEGEEHDKGGKGRAKREELLSKRKPLEECGSES